MFEEREIVIAGGGMVGMSLALLMRSRLPEHIRITLLESKSLPKKAEVQDSYPAFDGRTTALSYGSRLIFESLGLWSDFEGQASPIDSIHVSSKGSFGSSVLDSGDYGWPALGYVVENYALGGALLKAINKMKGIDLAGSSEVLDVKAADEAGTEITVSRDGVAIKMRSKLFAIADGSGSKLREAFFIETTSKPYDQEAIVANVGFEFPHESRAYERFTRTGPLALLPLKRSEAHLSRCGLVWSVNKDDAVDLELGTLDNFRIRLQKEFGFRMGRIVHIGQRTRFPLSLKKSREQVRQGVVVVGNAAHSLHPVAGQGLNLALRDAERLSKEVADAVVQGVPPGDLKMLEKYRAARERDQQIVVGVSDLLPRLFMDRNPFVGFSRSLALSCLDIFPPIKNKLVHQAAGMSF